MVARIAISLIAENPLQRKEDDRLDSPTHQSSISTHMRTTIIVSLISDSYSIHCLHKSNTELKECVGYVMHSVHMCDVCIYVNELPLI